VISVGLCFFFSGAAGLVYEVIWMRMLGLIFGHTVFAITTVLAAFMAGLALGAYLFGRLIDRRGRPLQVYGLLEAGIALYVLSIPLLFGLAQSAYLWLYRSLDLSFLTFSLAQFVLVFSILLIPTTLMGGSLPVLAKFSVNRIDGLGRKIGDLYALNTFGAVLGSGAAGFFLLPTLGVKTATFLAAAVNLIISAWAILADRWAGEPTASIPSQSAKDSRDLDVPAEPPHLVTQLVLLGTGLSGAVSMVYEIAWTRALSLIMGSSIYAFSAMLTTFLLGLALGSFLFARIWGRRPVTSSLFGWLEVAIGFSALGLVPVFGWMPDLVLAILKQTTPTAGGALLSQFALSLIVMIVPTTLIGAAFPCAMQICARALLRLGHDVGRVYTVNTIGTIAGALLTGFFLIPWLGAQTAMVVGAAGNALLGAALLFASAPVQFARRLALVIPIVLLFAAGTGFLPRWDEKLMAGGVSIYAQRFISDADPAGRFRQEAASRQLLFYREGINSTVVVERSERNTSLKIDGKVDASNGGDMMTQLMLGHLPLLLHSAPERVLVIGLGSGVTAGAVAQHPAVRQIEVVEIEPAVAAASQFFSRENRGVLRDPRLRLVIADARNYLLAGTARYDVVISEPSNPWMAGVGNLFSLEFYRLVRERLAEGGMIVQWVHGYSLFPGELKMIVNTFRQLFPHSTLWRTIRGDYLLVGTASTLSIDYPLLERRIAESPTAREDLASLGLASPLDLLALFDLDDAALARFSEGVPHNTDDRPLLEFAAPLALYADTTDMNSRLLHEVRAREFPPVKNLPPGLLEARRLHFARLYWARGEKEEALNQLRKAPQPSDITSRMARAKLLFSLGEVGQASDDLAGIARLQPQDRLIKSYLKAAAILRQLKAEEAVAQHGRTRLGDPNPAEAHNNVGVFYTRLGVRFGERAFFDLAVDALEAALHIEPQAYPVINNLGNAYFELGKLEEAAQAYREVIRLMPNLAEVRFNLGLVYEKQQRSALAMREYESAIILNPHWQLPSARLEDLRSKLPQPAGGGKSLDVAPQAR
jgi:spermidine synthase